VNKTGEVIFVFNKAKFLGIAIAMAKNFNAVKSKKNKPECSGYFVIMP